MQFDLDNKGALCINWKKLTWVINYILGCLYKPVDESSKDSDLPRQAKEYDFKCSWLPHHSASLPSANKEQQ